MIHLALELAISVAITITAYLVIGQYLFRKYYTKNFLSDNNHHKCWNCKNIEGNMYAAYTYWQKVAYCSKCSQINPKNQCYSNILLRLLGFPGHKWKYTSETERHCERCGNTSKMIGYKGIKETWEIKNDTHK